MCDLHVPWRRAGAWTSTPGDARDDCDADDDRADDADNDDGYDGHASDVASPNAAAAMNPWLTRCCCRCLRTTSAAACRCCCCCDNGDGDAGADADAGALFCPGNRSRCAAPTCCQ